MTNRGQKIISIFFVLVLSIVLVSLITKTSLGALDDSSSGNLEAREIPDPLEAELATMVSRYKNGKLDVIDVSTATTFSWDRLYMFGDYTSASEIDAVVGRSWRKNCYTEIGVSDGYILLVFTSSNMVVHCLDYPKNKGYFLIPEQAYNQGLSAQESRFVMNEHGDLIWLGNK